MDGYGILSAQNIDFFFRQTSSPPYPLLRKPNGTRVISPFSWGRNVYWYKIPPLSLVSLPEAKTGLGTPIMSLLYSKCFLRYLCDNTIACLAMVGVAISKV